MKLAADVDDVGACVASLPEDFARIVLGANLNDEPAARAREASGAAPQQCDGVGLVGGRGIPQVLAGEVIEPRR